MAAELFDLASLLTGDETRALETIETALASMQIDPCLEPDTARTQARLEVARRALRAAGVPSPEGAPQEPGPCLPEGEAETAGLDEDQLHTWLGRPAKPELRTWLEGLPAAERAVFVQRAVMGLSSESAAVLLNEAGSAGWSAAEVSRTFRNALCSLSSALSHVPAADALAI